jgi:argininosuccinate lyase
MSSIARTAATGDGELDPEFLRWSTSLPVDRHLLPFDVLGSQAHVAGLVAAGLIAAGDGERLRAGLQAVADKVEAGDVELPLEEDVHMAVERLLRDEVGELTDRLHTGRSRNDQVALDLALWTRHAVGQLREGVAAVLREVHAFRVREGDVAMPSYTHRQVAIPTLAWVWIDAALACGLERDEGLLALALTDIERSPLGAGAIGGTTLPIDPAVAAAALDFAGGPRNPIDAIGHRDHALTLAFACARISLHLARFAADVVELASDGLVHLGSAIACGSSMMPHKRNPDLFELVRAHAALRQGDLVALLTTFQGLGSGYHRDLQQDKAIVFRAVDGTADALAMTALGLRNLALVPDRCVQALRDGDAIATDLTEALVGGGTPFRAAYRAVGQLVATLRGQGRRLVDLDAALLAEQGLPVTLLDLLDVQASARRRAARFTR